MLSGESGRNDRGGRGRRVTELVVDANHDTEMCVCVCVCVCVQVLPTRHNGNFGLEDGLSLTTAPCASSSSNLERRQGMDTPLPQHCVPSTLNEGESRLSEP